MIGILYENSPWVFVFVTILLGGGAAYLTGHAIAQTWQRLGHMVFYIFLLALFVRFIHFALFAGTLLTLHYLLIDFLVLLGAAFLGFRITRVNQMVRQYPWLYQKAGPFNWKEKA